MSKQKELVKSKFICTIEVNWALGCIKKKSLTVVEEEQDIEGKTLQVINWKPKDFQLNYNADDDMNFIFEGEAIDNKDYNDANLSLDTEIPECKVQAVFAKMQDNQRFSGDLLKLLKKHNIDLKDVQEVEDDGETEEEDDNHDD